MRLIDADKIDFKKVFGGNSEFAIDIINGAQRLIDTQPTAFDKEKVIYELQKCEDDFYELWCEAGGEQNFGEARAYKNAIEIVKKGGIE